MNKAVSQERTAVDEICRAITGVHSTCNDRVNCITGAHSRHKHGQRYITRAHSHWMKHVLQERTAVRNNGCITGVHSNYMKSGQSGSISAHTARDRDPLISHGTHKKHCHFMFKFPWNVWKRMSIITSPFAHCRQTLTRDCRTTTAAV